LGSAFANASSGLSTPQTEQRLSAGRGSGVAAFVASSGRTTAESGVSAGAGGTVQVFVDELDDDAADELGDRLAQLVSDDLLELRGCGHGGQFPPRQRSVWLGELYGTDPSRQGQQQLTHHDAFNRRHSASLATRQRQFWISFRQSSAARWQVISA
jgi:hypothetical protein